MANQSIVALLPMKGHSERIPGKNLKRLVGKPLFFWILETLSASPGISKIVINTDSEEIATLAISHFDVVVHERPISLIGDFVSMNRIIEHDLSRLEGDEYFLQTHATNPLISLDTITKAIDCFFDHLDRYDSLFSVNRHQARFYDDSGRPVNHDPSELIRTQDLRPLYEENSNLYLFSRQSFFRRAQRIGTSSAMFEMDRMESTDLDSPSDWDLAEVMLRLENGRK